MSEAARAAERWRLRRDGPRARGAPGGVATDTAGASPDFHDHRPYVPGDDVRFVDWAVYGRTRELIVRLYRAEVAPGVDVFVDGSRSMALPDGRKEALLRELVDFVLLAARRAGERTSLHGLGATLQPASAAAELRLDAPRPGVWADVARWGSLARRGAVHVLISDFLTGSPAGPLIRHLASRAARLVVVQVLGPWEAAPPLGDWVTLQDAETGATHTLQITPEVRARYLARLAGARDEVAGVCAATRATFASVVADAPLEDVLRGVLLPAGIVEPA